MRIDVGTDIVSVPRIGHLIARRGDAFLQRWFTADEIAYCHGRAHPERHFAARFAAKESVVKALRVSRSGPPLWSCAEVVRDEQGRPCVRLSGPLLARARARGARAIRVSLASCADFATATAVVESTAPPDVAGGDVS